jgi:hypothetical protein
MTPYKPKHPSLVRALDELSEAMADAYRECVAVERAFPDETQRRQNAPPKRAPGDRRNLAMAAARILQGGTPGVPRNPDRLLARARSRERPPGARARAQFRCIEAGPNNDLAGRDRADNATGRTGHP